MAKLPAIQFYPGDWLRDEVAGCSLSAQGLWLRMLFIMHDAERYGYLSVNGQPMDPGSIARRCGCNPDEYLTLYAELSRASVPSVTNEGIIYSRRMVRDEARRKQNSLNGKRGGNPHLRKSLNPPDKPPVNPSLKMKMKNEEEESEEEKLLHEIRSYISAHPMLNYHAKSEGHVFRMVRAVGWDRTKKAIEDAIAKEKGDPPSYAASVIAGEQARDGYRPKATPAGEFAKQKKRYCPG